MTVKSCRDLATVKGLGGCTVCETFGMPAGSAAISSFCDIVMTGATRLEFTPRQVAQTGQIPILFK